MDENANIQINLYRLDDVVKNEVLKALNFYSKFDLTRDLILIDRANTCLTNIYNTINLDSSNEPVVSTLPDALYKENVSNILKVFDGFLDAMATRTPEAAGMVGLVKKNFQKIVLDALNVT